MGFVEEAGALKHTTKGVCLFGPKSSPPVALTARLMLLMQCVCLCYDIWCCVLQATSHVPRVSHSLRCLSPSPLIQAAVKSGFKWKEAMWNVSDSVHQVFPNSGLYWHNPSHVIFKAHASCFHIWDSHFLPKNRTAFHWKRKKEVWLGTLPGDACRHGMCVNVYFIMVKIIKKMVTMSLLLDVHETKRSGNWSVILPPVSCLTHTWKFLFSAEEETVRALIVHTCIVLHRTTASVILCVAFSKYLR